MRIRARRDAAPLSRAARRPNSAVPTRTIVAPSAIAASRSSDMPIDSVSTSSPSLRAAVEQLAHPRELRPLQRRVVAGRRDRHQPAQPQPRQAANQAGQRERLRRRAAALASPRR